MQWIYHHPFIYEFLDLVGSVGLTRRARRKVLMGIKGKVLEIGIGSGLSSKWLQGSSLFGVDISLPMLKAARRRGAKVCLADAHNLPFKEGVFDFAVFLFSLRLMHDQRRALKEALRVSGRAVVLEFVPLQKALERFGERVYGSGTLDESIFGGLDISKRKVDGLFVVYKVAKMEERVASPKEK